MKLRASRVLFISVLLVLVLGLLLTFNAVDGNSQTARYSNLRANQFMTAWLVLTPIPARPQADGTPDDTARKEAFARDYLTAQGGEAGVSPVSGQKVTIAGKDYEWRLLRSDSDVVSFAPESSAPAHSIAYAWAEVEVPEASKLILGIGSDDGVKLWVNGQLVHENWVSRGVEKDQDLVAVSLNKGANRLLLKVQNDDGAWGFTCRPLDGAALDNQFVNAAGRDGLDQVKKLLKGGVNVNARASATGLTALQSARVHGRKDVVEFLLASGADSSLEMLPVEEVVDRVFARIVKDNYPGAAVLAAKDGKVIYRKAFGLASVENRIPATPQTRFRIGSVTKQFTAAAILKLNEQGKISLDDKLSKFIPDFPRGEQVTIHHLLTHTSGIHSYTNKPDFLSNVTVPCEPEELIRSFKNDPYDFDPGRRWLYNNSGYFLLGYIIDKITGDSYADHLRKTFFEPLGMKDTGAHNSRDIIEHEAYGYSWDSGRVTKALNWDMSRAGAAGALYSTVDDLFLWNEALFGGRVLAASSLKAATTPVVTADDTQKVKEEGYGYGQMISKLRGLRVVSHGGGLHGFRCNLLAVPEERFTFIVLTNSAPPIPEMSVEGLSNEIAQLYLSDKMQAVVVPTADPSVSSSTYSDYVGQYDYGAAIMTVTLRGKQLFAQLSGQPAFEIYPNAKDVFFWKVVEAEVTFVRDDKGQVTKAVHRQGGQTINAPRYVEPAVAMIDPAMYDAYVGKYDFGQGIGIMSVTREADRLFAQLTGQPKFEIFPKSETEFFLKVVNAQIRFVKDVNGKVTKAVHSQAGRTLEVRRVE